MTSRPFSLLRAIVGAVVGAVVGMVVLVAASSLAITLLGGSDGAGVAGLAMFLYGTPGALVGGAALGGWLAGRARAAARARPRGFHWRRGAAGALGAVAGFAAWYAIATAWRVASGGMGSMIVDLILIIYAMPALIILGTIAGARATPIVRES